MKFFSTGHDRKKISAHATIYFPDHGHCLLLGVLLPFPGVHGGVGPAADGVLPEVVEVDAVVLGAKWPMLQFLKIKQTTSSKMLRFFDVILISPLFTVAAGQLYYGIRAKPLVRR